MSFEDNCVKEADIPNDLKKLKDEYKFFRDYLLELYLKVNYSDKAIIKTPINTVVGGLLKEAIELLDGIYILSSNYSVKNVVLLLRKLFEVYLQITFILIEKDKAEEKALIFLLKNNKLIFSDDDWNHFCDDIKNKSNYLGVDISIVKNCIEKVNNNNRTYNWFNVYDNKLKRFNNVSEELDTINPNGIFDSLIKLGFESDLNIDDKEVEEALDDFFEDVEIEPEHNLSNKSKDDEKYIICPKCGEKINLK